MWNTRGLFGGSNQNFGMQGGLNQGGGQGSTGNMFQTRQMMQLLGGGADAPDPQPTVRGRGPVPAAQPPLSPVSALEQLLILEENKQIRNRQRDPAYMNRSRQELQRRGQFPQQTNPSSGHHYMQPIAPGARQQQFPLFPLFPQRLGAGINVPVQAATGPYQPLGVNVAGNNIPRPPPTRSSAIVLRPSSTLGYSPPRGGRLPTSPNHGSYPEVLNHRNMPQPTAAPIKPGQEPVERNRQGQGQGHGNTASQGQPTALPRGNEMQRWNRYNSPRDTGLQNNFASASGGYNVQYKDQYALHVPSQGRHHGNMQLQYINHATNAHVGANQAPNSIARNILTQFKTPRTFGAAKFGGYKSTNTVPRNMNQLIRNQLFQRRLRTLGAPPGANMADVRADQADLMADRADNLQSMNPFQRLLQGTGTSGNGLGALRGFGGMPGGLQGTATSGNPMAAIASLLRGGGREGGLLPFALLG